MPRNVNAGVEQVALERLVRHPRNPRQGDIGAIVASIEANGFYGALVVQRGTELVLAGNHRLEAARILGMESVPVIWVDVDDDTALRILLADNRATDLATYDDAALAELLAELAQATTLEGTLWDGDDLDTLLADLAGPPSSSRSPENEPTTRCPSCGFEWSKRKA